MNDLGMLHKLGTHDHARWNRHAFLGHAYQIQALLAPQGKQGRPCGRLLLILPKTVELLIQGAGLLIHRDCIRTYKPFILIHDACV